MIGEIEAWPRYFGRWFSSVEPVSDFWVERNGKPVRRCSSIVVGMHARPFRSRPIEPSNWHKKLARALTALSVRSDDQSFAKSPLNY